MAVASAADARPGDRPYLPEPSRVYSGNTNQAPPLAAGNLDLWINSSREIRGVRLFAFTCGKSKRVKRVETGFLDDPTAIKAKVGRTGKMRGRFTLKWTGPWAFDDTRDLEGALERAKRTGQQASVVVRGRFYDPKGPAVRGAFGTISITLSSGCRKQLSFFAYKGRSARKLADF